MEQSDIADHNFLLFSLVKESVLSDGAVRHYWSQLSAVLSREGVAGELADPVLHRAGDDAVLRWNLPAANPVQIITVALQTPTQPQALFAGSTQGANMITTLEPYVGRIDVLDSLSVGTGLVTFTLKAVNASDAGHYICIEGVGNEPIIPDCGQMLVIVGESFSFQAFQRKIENGGDQNTFEEEKTRQCVKFWHDPLF